MLVVGSIRERSITFFDGDTLERLGEIEHVIPEPHEIAVDSARRRAFVAHTYREGAYDEKFERGHEISIVDVDRRMIVRVIDILPFRGAHDLSWDSVRELIWAGVEDVDGYRGLIAIDPETGQVTEAHHTDAPNIHWISLMPDASKAYAVHKEQAFMSVVDLTDGTVSTIAMPGGTEEVSVAPDGRWAYVATPLMNLEMNVARGEMERGKPRAVGHAPQLLKIDTDTNRIVASIDFPEMLAAVRVATDGTIIVTDWRFRDEADRVSPGFVHVIDGESFTLRGSVPVGELPFSSRFHDLEPWAFVTNVRSGTVSVVDVNRLEVVATLDQASGSAFAGTHGIGLVTSGADRAHAGTGA